MQNVKDLTEILFDKTDEADALVKAGEAGDLTQAQNREWSALMDEKTGEIPAITIELAEAVKRENEVKSLAAARLSAEIGTSPFQGGLDDDPRSLASTGPKFRNLSNGKDVFALLPEEKFAPVENRVSPFSEPDETPSVGDLIHSLLTGEPQNMSSGKFNELVGGSDSGGGYILTPILSGNVIDLARSASVAMRAGAVTLPMDAREMHIARLTQDPTGHWRPEGTAVEASALAFDRVTLRAKTLAAIVPVSMELLEDASNIGSIITAALQAALGSALDQAVLFGSGSEENPRGIRNATGVNTIATVGTPTDYSAMTSAVSAILAANYPGEIGGLSWITNPREGETFDGLTDTTGQPLNPTPWAGALKRFSTTSLPSTEGGGSDESVSIIGDFSQVLVGMKGSGITVRILDSGQVSDGTVTHNAASELKKLVVAHMRADVALLRPAWMTVLSGITAA